MREAEMQIKLNYGDTLNIDDCVYEFERVPYKTGNACSGCDLYNKIDSLDECNIDCGDHGVMIDTTPKAIILCPFCNYDEHKMGEDGKLVCKECNEKFIIGI
jgi:hypothetical protein